MSCSKVVVILSDSSSDSTPTAVKKAPVKTIKPATIVKRELKPELEADIKIKAPNKILDRNPPSPRWLSNTRKKRPRTTPVHPLLCPISTTARNYLHFSVQTPVTVYGKTSIFPLSSISFLHPTVLSMDFRNANSHCLMLLSLLSMMWHQAIHIAQILPQKLWIRLVISSSSFHIHLLIHTTGLPTSLRQEIFVW